MQKAELPITLADSKQPHRQTIRSMHTFTDRDIDLVNFEDNFLRGMLLRSDFESGRSELILDIDYTAEAVVSNNQQKWMVAAATLIFHGVTGLKFAMDSNDPNFQVCIPGDWISTVERTPVVPQLVHLDRAYWRWDFTFALQTTLSFGSYGFTLEMRQEPVLWDDHQLPLSLRVDLQR